MPTTGDAWVNFSGSLSNFLCKFIVKGPRIWIWCDLDTICSILALKKPVTSVLRQQRLGLINACYCVTWQRACLQQWPLSSSQGCVLSGASLHLEQLLVQKRWCGFGVLWNHAAGPYLQRRKYCRSLWLFQAGSCNQPRYRSSKQSIPNRACLEWALH